MIVPTYKNAQQYQSYRTSLGWTDSILALKLVKDQNVEVIVGYLLLPFADDKRDYAEHIAS